MPGWQDHDPQLCPAQSESWARVHQVQLSTLCPPHGPRIHEGFTVGLGLSLCLKLRSGFWLFFLAFLMEGSFFRFL